MRNKRGYFEYSLLFFAFFGCKEYVSRGDVLLGNGFDFGVEGIIGNDDGGCGVKSFFFNGVKVKREEKITCFDRVTVLAEGGKISAAQRNRVSADVNENFHAVFRKECDGVARVEQADDLAANGGIDVSVAWLDGTAFTEIAEGEGFVFDVFQGDDLAAQGAGECVCLAVRDGALIIFHNSSFWTVIKN